MMSAAHSLKIGPSSPGPSQRTQPALPPAADATGFCTQDFLCHDRPYTRADFPFLSGMDSEPALLFAASKLFVDVPPQKLAGGPTPGGGVAPSSALWQAAEAFGDFAAVFDEAERVGLSRHRLTWPDASDFNTLQATSPKIICYAGVLEYSGRCARQVLEERSAVASETPTEGTRTVPSPAQIDTVMRGAADALLVSYGEVAEAGMKLFGYARARRRLDQGEAMADVERTNPWAHFDPLCPKLRDLMLEVSNINHRLNTSELARQGRSQEPLEIFWQDWFETQQRHHASKWRDHLLQ